ncbi:5'-methylthioadenosine/S-adenosylhomocysteine nucleosidase, partial [Vibrio lentus]
MKVGIIGAMEQEVAILKQSINQMKEEKKGGCTFFSGDIDGVEVVLLQSGIGKVAAAVGTTLLISEHQPDV